MNLRNARLCFLVPLTALVLAACTKREEAPVPTIPPTELAATDTPPPVYPPEAECNSEGGTTVLRVTIEKDGVPSRVSLQLSGHTHGGQVRMLGWSPIAPSGQQLAYGHIRMNCDVVVSGGLGCSLMPFRLGVPPEIVLVTLGGGGREPAVA